MRNIDDSIEWTVRGDNTLTGTYRGKKAVGELWGKFMTTDFRTKPHDFIAEDDKVVVLTTVHLGGEDQERPRRDDVQPAGQARRVRDARRRDGCQPGVRQVASPRDPQAKPESCTKGRPLTFRPRRRRGERIHRLVATERGRKLASRRGRDLRKLRVKGPRPGPHKIRLRIHSDKGKRSVVRKRTVRYAR